MCRMQLKTSCIRQLQNDKFLIVSQGQTFNNIGVYLPSPVYSHGQLYVAISRVTTNANIKIFSGQGFDKYMRNVVYKEVLEL
jgi:ATP-dependent exoDNAse (exonuclease V) alpha subunit